MPDGPSASNIQLDDIAILVEKQDMDKYRLRADSAQLERIGVLLRGKTRFSILNYIIIPLVVSLGTIMFTGAFQYISWLNTVRVQKATDRATKAVVLYQKVAGAIAARYYGTLLFTPAAQGLANGKNPDSSELSKLAVDTDRQRVASYYDTLRIWNEQYDLIITELDYIFDKSSFGQVTHTYSNNSVRANTVDSVNCKLS